MNHYDPEHVAVATKFDVNFEVMEFSVEKFREFVNYLNEEFDGIPIDFSSSDACTYEFSRAKLESVIKSEDHYSEMVEIAHTILSLGDERNNYIRVELD